MDSEQDPEDYGFEGAEELGEQWPAECLKDQGHLLASFSPAAP